MYMKNSVFTNNNLRSSILKNGAVWHLLQTQFFPVTNE